ncbi:MAG: hypothetical protein U0640_02105 [Phycisphaerales bacterium]
MTTKVLHSAIVQEMDRIRAELDSAYPRLTWIGTMSTFQLSVIAYTFRSELLPHFGSRFDVSVTTIFGVITVGLLLGAFVMAAFVIKPRKGKRWGNAEEWLKWEQQATQSMPNKSVEELEAMTTTELSSRFAEIAEQNRNRVEQRFYWLDHAQRLLSWAMVSFVIYMLAAGIQRVTMPPIK